MPTRSCSAASGFGAHQLALPITCIIAGTSTVRIRVASISTAKVSPSPNILMNGTSEAASAANEIDMSNAAAVITLPVRATLSATPSSLARAVRSESTQCSRNRDTRKTS